jgi:hypothetical protein
VVAVAVDDFRRECFKEEAVDAVVVAVFVEVAAVVKDDAAAAAAAAVVESRDVIGVNRRSEWSCAI